MCITLFRYPASLTNSTHQRYFCKPLRPIKLHVYGPSYHRPLDRVSPLNYLSALYMNIVVLGVHFALGSIAYFAVVTTSEV